MEIVYRAGADPPRATTIEQAGALISELAAGNENLVPRLIDAILEAAATVGASDIHIEARRDGAIVRYRVDGQLLTVAKVPLARSENVFARLKMLSRVVTYRKRSPQDGRLAEAEGGALRTAFMPTLHGEKAVLRLPNLSAPRELDQLGMSAHDLERLKQILLLAQGAIFFTGPSSSGKSTSIYAALRFLLANSSLPPNIATLEDPVEQELDGVNQTQIDPVGGLTFAIGLRTLLRMDPNVIVVGEVRDEETAQTAVQAGLSGHLVISTIHSGTAAQVFARLLHMRIEPFLLSSSVAAVVAQRLVRRLCVACRRERAVSAAEARRCFGEVAPPDRVFSAGGGCPQCNGTGHSGRAALFELAIPDDAMREGLLENASTAQLQKLAVSAGMTPLRHAAAEAVCSGRVSLEEIARALG